MQKVPLGELEVFARTVVEKIQNSPRKGGAYIVALEGDLGAGKTTFTQALGRVLGVDGVVQSPTYILMKAYPIHAGGFTELVHIDAYRLEQPEEFETLKPESFLHNPRALVVVEWPERLLGVLPKPDLTIKFSSNNAAEGERFVEVQ